MLPKKRRLSRADKEHEYDKEFVQEKKKHSAIECAIIAFQAHGLNKNPGHKV
ncbi:MAG: hypothetical protein L3J59_12395 [Methylococcaceae bacterium]|nr:hypothetical protein [Methylococcaceae bacterium]